ncbi:uncharacterized protein LOC120330683 isoform X1 [Styela clava]
MPPTLGGVRESITSSAKSRFFRRVQKDKAQDRTIHYNEYNLNEFQLLHRECLRSESHYRKTHYFNVAAILPMYSATTKTAFLYILFLVISCLACFAKSSVTGNDVTSNGRGIEVSLLDYNHILLSESDDKTDEKTPTARPQVSANGSKILGLETSLHESHPISLDGFNLLWLIASKLRAGDKLIRIENDTNILSLTKSNKIVGWLNNTDLDEVYLDSARPRHFLRYGKKLAPLSRLISKGSDTSFVMPPLVMSHLSDYLDAGPNHHTLGTNRLPGKNLHTSFDSKDIVRINRFIVGNSIGFEMEFRMEDNSGSGYIIAGRSLNGQPIFSTGSQVKSPNVTSDQQSWFGLYAHTRATSYILRLEYRNFAWDRKKQIQIRFSDDFRKGEWQKLAVNIDFNANTINYWVNCSTRPTVQLRANISHPSSFYSVYRLLQHRRHSRLPVKVTFRAVIVTDGNRRTVPRHCQQQGQTVCTGGKIYMQCGPSCERTCRGAQDAEVTDDYLRTCAIACIAGCHCPPGFVTHAGVCVRPEQCPCMFGSTAHEIGTNVTINNELCTCIKGKWSCYALPQFIYKPENLNLSAGRTGQLNCAVSGNPLPKITWEVPPGATYDIVTRSSGRVSVLILRNVTGKEAGLYQCKASLPSGVWNGVESAIVRILSLPVITLPHTIPVTRGYPVLAIDCSVTGLPKPRLWWKRNDEQVIPGDRIQIYRPSQGVLRLKLQNVQVADAGEWACHARNAAGYTRRAVRILVRLPEPNSMAFYRKPVDQYVKRGHTAIFNCEILEHHSMNLNITWLKDGVRVDIGEKRKVVKRYRLVIRQVRDEDAGVYMCIVTVRRGGRELKAKAELMIKGQMLPWSDWSSCSASCNEGFMFKKRTCTGIPANDRTCHGKLVHIKKCSTQVCPGICSAVGDPHYTTFDGRRFNFHGDCGYVLSHDASGNEFKVLLYNGRCGPRLSCLNSVTIILSLTGLAAVVDIQRGGSVTVNSAHVTLPYTIAGDSLTIDKIGLYIVLTAGNDFELKWALPHRLYLTIGPKYFGRTQGFCGNYNGDPTDDNILRSGRPVSSDLEFGLNWSLSEGTIDYSCSVFRQLSRPCDRDKYLRETAIGACSFLLDQSSFGPCHKKVLPGPYIESCKFDVCSTSIKRTSIYFCVALSAYADECLRKGVILNWRTEDICKEHCSSGNVYKECGPRCVRYCPGVINDSGKICASNERCVSGCHCPDEMVLHEGKCINFEQCPCVDAGTQFANGTSHNRNCEKCICYNGQWKCSFNKDLCEFPSSLIRTPVSQIVPSGYSVSFCCEAAGIPTPTVEWFRDGRLIPPQTESEDDPKSSGPVIYGHSKAYLTMKNISKIEEGIYTCKASNLLGSQMSDPAVLRVVEPWTATCNPIPSRRTLNLPDGCYVARSREDTLNVGQCIGLPCFYDNPELEDSHRRSSRKCGRTRQCCRPSVTSPVTVNCSHMLYSASFVVTTVQKCACSSCEDRVTVVEGALKTAITGELLRHVKIMHQLRVVGYTSSTGSFRISFASLPEDIRYVTLTFDDVIFKRFPSTVKNLPVIFGDVTIHTVQVNGRSYRKRFDASLGLKYMFSRSPSSSKSERLRLIIPPSSLILQRAQDPFIGQVDAVISIVRRDYKIDERKLHTVPGNFVGLNLQGSKKIILPSYILSVSLYNRFGRALELLPKKPATFLVNTIAFGERIEPWKLDDLTGLWRERDTKVEIEPAFNKRGEKVLQLSAKIPRLDTPWALSDSEPPCFVRVRVLDNNNNTVSGVRVIMKTTDELPESFRNGRRSLDGGIAQMQTLVEGLTRATDTNGICLPVGCKKIGYITAWKQGNDLSMLAPDVPHREMGRVTSSLPHLYGISSVVVQTSDHFSLNYLAEFDQEREPPSALYFRQEEDCRNTAPDKRTYVFRDRDMLRESDFRAASRAGDRIKAVAPGDGRLRHSSSKTRTFCHVKVSVTISDQATLYRAVPMVVEAVAFRHQNGSREMTILGWSKANFRTPTFRRPTYGYAGGRRRYRARARKATEEICVEYLCGEEEPTDFVYITVKPEPDKNTGRRESRHRPIACEFIKGVNFSDLTSGVRLQVRPDKDSTTRMSFPKGGYISLPPRKASRRKTTSSISSMPEIAFPAKSFIESKNKCEASRGDRFLSAWVKCS